MVSSVGRSGRILTSSVAQLHIWDFSGQTALYFVNGSNGFVKDYHKQSELEVMNFVNFHKILATALVPFLLIVWC